MTQVESSSSSVEQTEPQPVLTLVNVRKVYEQTGHAVEALADINLSVARGIIQGVIGFSGAGKSTLVRCVSGLEQPEEGHIIVAGRDLAHLEGTSLREARRQIGVVFQHFNLLHSRTVAGNVSLGLEMAGRPKEEIRQRVAELLAWFGLTEKAAQYPAQLSGGQRQRVAIARALALQPAVLLTDEPTSALDNETTTSVLNLLRRVRDEFHVTILLITHDLASVRAICDRVAVLDAGRIVEEGRMEDVLLSPESSAAQRLIHTPVVLDAAGPATNAAFSAIIEVKVVGSTAAEPLLSQLTKAFGVEVNILRAQIDRLNETAYAFFVIQLSGDKLSVEQSISSLLDKGIAVTRLPVEATHE